MHGDKPIVELAKQIPDFMRIQTIKVMVLHALGVSLKKSKNAYVLNQIKKEFPSCCYEVTQAYHLCSSLELIQQMVEFYDWYLNM